MSRGRASLLYLQMGQEVIYIMLSSAILISILLLSMWVQTRTSLENEKRAGTELRGKIVKLKDKNSELERNVGGKVSQAEFWRVSQERDANALSLASLRQDIKNVSLERDRLRAEIADLKKVRLNNDQPPIILLTESEGYTFETGSARISPGFEEKVKSNVVPKVKDYAEKYSAKIIEIIGHTDEVRYGGTRRDGSGLDRTLLDALNDRSAPETLVPFDNVGLGMVRAASVRKLLIDLGLSPPDFTILPLSAGPVITIEERVAQGVPTASGDEARRRIEVRLRRNSKTER